MLKKNLFSFLLVVSIFTLDRVSKYIILEKSKALEVLNINVNSFLNFNLVWNNGIAFGLLSFDQEIYYNSLTILICLITLIIAWLLVKSSGFEKMGFLMIIGGSLGNLFDRLFYSAVPDFIDLYYNNFHWFIFNVADIFITLGVLLLITLEIFTKKKIMIKNFLLLLTFILIVSCSSSGFN